MEIHVLDIQGNQPTLIIVQHTLTLTTLFDAHLPEPHPQLVGGKLCRPTSTYRIAVGRGSPIIHA